MTVNFNKAFTDGAGNPLESSPNIGTAIATRLFNLDKMDGVCVSADEKYRAYSLSRRFSDSPDAVNLTTEEAAFIKKVCADTFTAGAYGQIVDLIEG